MSVSLHFPFADGRELAGSLPDHFTGETRFGPAIDAIAETGCPSEAWGSFMPYRLDRHQSQTHSKTTHRVSKNGSGEDMWMSNGSRAQKVESLKKPSG